MRKILIAALLSTAILSCTDTKKQEDELLNDVVKTHDQVMAKSEVVMTNKMQLDTLIKLNKSEAVTSQAKVFSAQLDTADAHMENWMHNFDAEHKDKSHDEVMKYLAGQKEQIEGIDKEMNTVVASSAKFIKANK